jgi:uncharacterized protein (TIGR00369 family)
MTVIDDVWREPSRGVCVPPSDLRLSGLEYARLLTTGTLPESPITRLTGRRVIAADQGAVTFSMPATDWLLGPKGRVLNSALVFLAHGPGWMAVQSSLPVGVYCTVAELSVTFLQEPPGAGGELIAEGRLIHVNDVNGLSEVFVRDGNNALLAHCTARCFVFPGAGAESEDSAVPAVPQESTGYPTPDPYHRPASGQPVDPDVFERRTGLDILRAQADGKLPQSPIHHLTGLRPTDVDQGRAAFVLPATGWLRNDAGAIFGGAIALLANSAAAGAVQTVAPVGTRFAALDVKVNFLRPVAADGANMVATGVVAHRGQRLVIATADVLDGEGRRIALATGTTALEKS